MNANVAPLLAGVDEALLKPPVNVLRLSLHPSGLAPRIANLTEWRAHLLMRLRAQIGQTADAVLIDLLAELSKFPATNMLKPLMPPPRDETGGVFVPFQLVTDAGKLSFLSTTTVFGTPIDVTLSELALECFFSGGRRHRAGAAAVTQKGLSWVSRAGLQPSWPQISPAIARYLPRNRQAAPDRTFSLREPTRLSASGRDATTPRYAACQGRGDELCPLLTKSSRVEPFLSLWQELPVRFWCRREGRMTSCRNSEVRTGSRTGGRRGSTRTRRACWPGCQRLPCQTSPVTGRRPRVRSGGRKSMPSASSICSTSFPTSAPSRSSMRRAATSCSFAGSPEARARRGRSKRSAWID